MRIAYTKHAEEKLQRPDIVQLGIIRDLLQRAILSPEHSRKTKTGEFSRFYNFRSRPPD
jgi:hypothetical protein